MKSWYNSLPDNTKRIIRTILQIVIGLVVLAVAGAVTYAVGLIPTDSIYYAILGGSTFSGVVSTIAAALMNRAKREIEAGTNEIIHGIGSDE